MFMGKGAVSQKAARIGTQKNGAAGFVSRHAPGIAFG
jgi:hypothetical protein